MEQPPVQQDNEQASLPPLSIYINSFAAGLSTGDIFIVLQRNGKDIGVLNMSYTVAKSLASGVNQLIASLEKRSGRQIMSSVESSEALSKPDEEFRKIK